MNEKAFRNKLSHAINPFYLKTVLFLRNLSEHLSLKKRKRKKSKEKKIKFINIVSLKFGYQMHKNITEHIKIIIIIIILKAIEL